MEQGTTYLFTQGVLGIVVVALATVCIKLYNKIERLETEKTALMEARRQDTVETLNKVTEVLQTNSQTNRLLTEKIETAKTTAGKQI